MVRKSIDQETIKNKTEVQLFLYDPLAQIKMLLANKKYSSAVMTKSTYLPNGPRNDITSGSKFHQLFADAIKQEKIPLMGM